MTDTRHTPVGTSTAKAADKLALAQQALNQAQAALTAEAPPIVGFMWAFYAARLLAPAGCWPGLEVTP